LDLSHFVDSSFVSLHPRFYTADKRSGRSVVKTPGKKRSNPRFRSIAMHESHSTADAPSGKPGKPAKQALVESGELSPRNGNDFKEACDKIVAA
jgi:hypothetical protein